MYDNVRSNIFKQGTKILHSIAEHYEVGTIESPDANHLMMQLFALVAEDKVEGIVDEETGLVKWSLTKDFEKQVNDARSQTASENVVKGPW